ncbi:hypothetical protein JST99_00285 [Candidatus Dependentiae bacterium]|nr:hypothetical protein [Candidatus Dependentiae bacterium]MCC7415460.1 hypothetical protein [Campylobacterota bacterium]
MKPRLKEMVPMNIVTTCNKSLNSFYVKSNFFCVRLLRIKLSNKALYKEYDSQFFTDCQTAAYS